MALLLPSVSKEELVDLPGLGMGAPSCPMSRDRISTSLLEERRSVIHVHSDKTASPQHISTVVRSLILQDANANGLNALKAC